MVRSCLSLVLTGCFCCTILLSTPSFCLFSPSSCPPWTWLHSCCYRYPVAVLPIVRASDTVKHHQEHCITAGVDSISLAIPPGASHCHVSKYSDCFSKCSSCCYWSWMFAHRVCSLVASPLFMQWTKQVSVKKILLHLVQFPCPRHSLALQTVALAQPNGQPGGSRRQPGGNSPGVRINRKVLSASISWAF